MTREEAEQRGLTPREVQHNGHRRAPWHDYNRPGIYMVTLVVDGRQRLFGTLAGRTRAARGSAEAPHVELSALGRCVLNEEVRKISEHYPMVEVCRVVVMPDHLHLLLRVHQPLPEGKNLGQVVRGFKTGCTRAWWRLQDEGKGGAGNGTRGTNRGNGKPLAAAPGSLSAAPGSLSAGPGSLSAGPGSLADVPGSLAAAPGSLSAAPGSLAAAPGSLAAAPDSLAAAPDSLAAAPGSLSAAPGSLSAAPDSLASAPGSLSSAPGSLSAAPGSLSAGPGSLAAAPGSLASGAITVPFGFPKGQRGGWNQGQEDEGEQRPLLFESGYHDRIVRDREMLANVVRYMDENPFRAVLRREVPHLMQRRLHLWIHDREYAAFGNLFLLKYPDKEQVFFHRKADDGTPTHLTAAYAQARDALLRRAEEGTVLVTPGISKGEQGVVTEALQRQLPLILLQKEPITDFWKPPQGRFFACAEGRLLILAPWTLDEETDYGRFHTLNELAHDVCIATDTRMIFK